MKHAYAPWSYLLQKSAVIRLLVGIIFMIPIGIAYVYFFQYFNGGFWGTPAASIGNFVLVHLLAFCWLYWWTLSMDNWPFSLWLPQPLQGLIVGICSIILGYFSYFIFAVKLGWAVQIFPLGTWWLFFVFAIPAWMGGFIPDAYGRKQPLTGISIHIASFGLGVIGWWLALGATTDSMFTGLNGSGALIGMPFVWFPVAVAMAFTMGMWPVNVKQPAQFVLFIGFLGTFSMLYLWLLHALGMDFFTGPPNHAAVYTILWMMPALVWIGLGQGYPLHNSAPWVKGLVIVGLSMIVGYIIFKSLILPAAPADLKSPEHALFMTSALNWTLGIFMGWAITWCSMGWIFLPPPADISANNAANSSTVSE